MEKVRIWTVMVSLVALVIFASGCAVVDPQTGAPTRSARFWIRAGALSDATGSTSPYNDPAARPVEE